MHLLSPAGRAGRLSVLIFHRVLASPDPIFEGEVDAQRFDAICSWVRQWCHVLPLDEAITRLGNGSLPASALAITFDDGYADNHDVALPILQHHGLSATFFVATGFLDGGCMWNDRVIEAVRQCPGDTLILPGSAAISGGAFDVRTAQARRQTIEHLLRTMKYLSMAERLVCADGIARASGASMPADLMMSSGQVAALTRNGMLVGGHTVNHPILATLNDKAALQEITAGKHALESMTQAPVDFFAYPNGKPGTDYSDRDVALVVSAGFKAAFSTTWGVSTAASDWFQLSRFSPWDRSRLRYGLRLALNMRSVTEAAASESAAAPPPTGRLQ